MKRFIYNSMVATLILSLVIMVLIAVGTVVKEITKEEIESYTVGAEVSHTDYTQYYSKHHGTRTDYIIAVRNDDFATVFNVSAETYAKYAVGDVVEVEVREMANKYDTWYEYDLIG